MRSPSSNVRIRWFSQWSSLVILKKRLCANSAHHVTDADNILTLLTCQNIIRRLWSSLKSYVMTSCEKIQEPSFKALEILNAKIEVWIDEEQFSRVYKALTFDRDTPVYDCIENVKRIFSKDDDLTDKEKENLFSYFEKLINFDPSKYIKIIDPDTHHRFSEEQTSALNALFVTKYLRALIMEDGTDESAEYLDHLIPYLYRQLPYQFPSKDEDIIVQQLYFQELSACGRPGHESLGYAIRAEELIKNKYKDARFVLYSLWAKLNKGIGYYHSQQMKLAALSLNEIIKELKEPKNLVGHVDSYWSADDVNNIWSPLIYEPAILFKAEVQQELQFSYHVMQTLGLLKDRKKERRILLEALAYKDMGRLEDFETKITELWGEKAFDGVNSVIEIYSKWQVGAKNNLSTQCIGILVDYYLEKITKKEQSDIKEIETFTNFLESYFDRPEWSKLRLGRKKSERMGFYQQAARYLAWLVYPPKNLDEKHCLELAKQMFEKFKDSFEKLDLGSFKAYEYDRYTDSIEKFFRSNLGKSFKHESQNFSSKVKKFESGRNLMFQYKKAEREHWEEVLGVWDEIKNNNECKLCLPNKISGKNISAVIPECPQLKPSRKSGDQKDQESEDFLLRGEDYLAIINEQRDKFHTYIDNRSQHPGQEKSINFIGLQRWNSSTPAIALSLGGGYFIYQTDDKGTVELGIAIDPGFNFLENLFSMGFTLSDIDFILITHGHADHIRDFEPIIDLLHFMRKERTDKTDRSKDKKVYVILSLGVYDRLKRTISDTSYREYLSDTYIIDIDKEIEDGIKEGKSDALPQFGFKREGDKWIGSETLNLSSSDLIVKPTWAYHDDKTKISDSYGFILQFPPSNGDFRLGYTGDTKWVENAHKQYDDCQTIIIHLGSLIKRSKTFNYYDNPMRCRELIADEGHPYLFGLLRYMTAIADSRPVDSSGKRLILLSEFGEELKGKIRIDLTKRLSEVYKEKLMVLPVDVGLNIRLTTMPKNKGQGVKCVGCEKFVDVKDIDFEAFGHGYDEALFFFCRTCLRSKPRNIIDETMKRICEFGIPLQKGTHNN